MKKTTNKPITPQQIKALHATYRDLSMSEDVRRDLLHHFTEGRTQSTKELTMDEAIRLLTRLRSEQSEKLAKMIQTEKKAVLRAIYHLSFKISFLNEGYDSDTPEEFEMNKAKINSFCKTHTKARKPITQMTLDELEEVKKQLEKIARKESKL